MTSSPTLRPGDVRHADVDPDGDLGGAEVLLCRLQADALDQPDHRRGREHRRARVARAHVLGDGERLGVLESGDECSCMAAFRCGGTGHIDDAPLADDNRPANPLWLAPTRPAGRRGAAGRGPMILRIDHIGLVARSLEEASDLLIDTLGFGLAVLVDLFAGILAGRGQRTIGDTRPAVRRRVRPRPRRGRVRGHRRGASRVRHGGGVRPRQRWPWPGRSRAPPVTTTRLAHRGHPRTDLGRRPPRHRRHRRLTGRRLPCSGPPGHERSGADDVVALERGVLHRR